MSFCIICLCEFETAKPEHILIDSLGGKKTTTLYLCTTCNEKSGNTIDKSLAEKVGPIRNLLNLKSGSGDPPPTIRDIDLPSGRKIDLLPGGVPVDKKVIYIRTKGEKESDLNVQIGVHSLEKLASLIGQFAKGANISPEQLLGILSNKDLQVEVQRIDEYIPFKFAFGLPGHQACAAKMCFMLWAVCTQGSDIQHSNYDKLRKELLEAISGKMDNSNLAKTDARTPVSLPQESWGNAYNMIYVESDQQGKVRGLFRLFNTVNFYVDLGTSNSNKSFSCYLISNPETGAWKCENVAVPGMSKWIVDGGAQDPKTKMENLRTAIGALMTYNYEKANAEYRKKIIEDAIVESLPAEGEIIEEIHVNRLSREAAEAMIAFAWGSDRTKTLDKDFVKRKLEELTQLNTSPNNRNQGPTSLKQDDDES